MDLDASASTFPVLESPRAHRPVQSAQSKRHRLERGGPADRGVEDAVVIARVLANIPSKIRNPEFQGPAGSNACRLWLITIPASPCRGWVSTSGPQ